MAIYRHFAETTRAPRAEDLRGTAKKTLRCLEIEG
jgi:hypothetical protein